MTSSVVYPVCSPERAADRPPADANPFVVRCTFAETGEPWRGQSFKSSRYSSLFRLRQVPFLTTLSKEGLLIFSRLSVRSITSTSEPEAGISHPLLTGVCGTDSVLDCTVCFHLLAGLDVAPESL
jgi:hypothetical protein